MGKGHLSSSGLADSGKTRPARPSSSPPSACRPTSGGGGWTCHCTTGELEPKAPWTMDLLNFLPGRWSAVALSRGGRESPLSRASLSLSLSAAAEEAGGGGGGGGGGGHRPGSAGPCPRPPALAHPPQIRNPTQDQYQDLETRIRRRSRPPRRTGRVQVHGSGPALASHWQESHRVCL